MSALPRPKLNRIPGGGISLPQAKENHTKDLTTLTRVELLEIKDREGKLLANKKNLARLPDKGERIKNFYDKVIAELERRANVDEAAAMFSELNIASKAQNALNELEWSGKLKSINEMDPTNDVLDSDDEVEMDPLRIIAKAQMHERTIKVLPAEPNLITPEDLAEIASFKTNSLDSGLGTIKQEENENNTESTDSASETSEIIEAELVAIDVAEKLNNIKSKLKTINTKSKSPSDDSLPLEQIEPHVRYLVEKTEHQPTTMQQREKFRPYKTTISDVHAPEKERTRKKGKHWEITAATPPPIQHNSTQMLTLLDSVQIQANYLEKLKRLQEQQAAERLAAKMERLSTRNIQLPAAAELKQKESFTAYRDNIEGSQRINEEDEVHDILDSGELGGGGGGVTYTVYE